MTLVFSGQDDVIAVRWTSYTISQLFEKKSWDFFVPAQMYARLPLLMQRSEV
mgnify:CR=1 FL=1